VYESIRASKIDIDNLCAKEKESKIRADIPNQIGAVVNQLDFFLKNDYADMCGRIIDIEKKVADMYDK